jgi:hypothetical protein
MTSYYLPATIEARSFTASVRRALGLQRRHRERPLSGGACPAGFGPGWGAPPDPRASVVVRPHRPQSPGETITLTAMVRDAMEARSTIGDGPTRPGVAFAAPTLRPTRSAGVHPTVRVSRGSRPPPRRWATRCHHRSADSRSSWQQRRQHRTVGDLPNRCACWCAIRGGGGQFLGGDQGWSHYNQRPMPKITESQLILGQQANNRTGLVQTEDSVPVSPQLSVKRRQPGPADRLWLGGPVEHLRAGPHPAVLVCARSLRQPDRSGREHRGRPRHTRRRWSAVRHDQRECHL